MTVEAWVEELKVIKPDAVVVGCEPESAWQADDREWYASHPTRGYRMRKAHQGEPGLEDSTWVLVKHVCQGARSKLPVCWQGDNGAVDMLAELVRLSEVTSQDNYYDIVLGLIYEGIVKRRFQPLGTILVQAEALHGWAPTTRQ